MAFKPLLARFVAGMLLVAAALSALPLIAAAQTAASAPVKLVGLGDSLMAGYQLPPEQSLTAQLESRMKAAGLNVTIENAAVSGDTTQGGLSRVDWSVPDGTQGVILELGANDALRGIPPEQTEKNLDAIIARLKDRGIAVMLVGMYAPPNMGKDYADRFNPIYPDLARKHALVFYPFALDGVVLDDKLKLSDGMHPNGEGVGVMAEGMLADATALVQSILGKTK